MVVIKLFNFRPRIQESEKYPPPGNTAAGQGHDGKQKAGRKEESKAAPGQVWSTSWPSAVCSSSDTVPGHSHKPCI